MMTRTSRGHTGRPLRADAFDTACCLMIAMSAVVRVFVPLVAPEQLVVAVAGPAALWSAGFAIFFRSLLAGAQQREN
jgi:uncharacterized protein involved in response to NO